MSAAAALASRKNVQRQDVYARRRGCLTLQPLPHVLGPYVEALGELIFTAFNLGRAPENLTMDLVSRHAGVDASVIPKPPAVGMVVAQCPTRVAVRCGTAAVLHRHYIASQSFHTPGRG